MPYADMYVRRICEKSMITQDGVYSEWSPYPGIFVRTTLTLDESGQIIYADANTNLLHPKTAIPAILYQIRRGEQTVKTRVETGWTV